MDTPRFWAALEQLVRQHQLVVDRPRGTPHPRYASWTYPLDYGYLEGTTSGDGRGVDVWRGTHADATLTAVLCCVDVAKRDVEVKLLIGCTADEIEAITAIHNDGDQAAVAIPRALGSQ